jgi:L-lactate utilization protein LutB
MLYFRLCVVPVATFELRENLTQVTCCTNMQHCAVYTALGVIGAHGDRCADAGSRGVVLQMILKLLCAS